MASKFTPLFTERRSSRRLPTSGELSHHASLAGAIGEAILRYPIKQVRLTALAVHTLGRDGQKPPREQHIGNAERQECEPKGREAEKAEACRTLADQLGVATRFGAVATRVSMPLIRAAKLRASSTGSARRPRSDRCAARPG